MLKNIFLFIIFCSAIQNLKAGIAPTLNCDSFCVISIRYDIVNPNYLYVDIANNGSDFINYPIVQLIDTSGDTVANQQKLFDYYGQGQHTTQSYHITTTLDSFPLNWIGQVRLEDGLYHTACIINFPCAGITTGITEEGNNSGFTIYPNPVSSQLFIRFAENPTEDVEIILYNQLGQIIRRVNPSSKISIIDTENLFEGVYFVSINQKQQRLNSKIIVQK